MFVLILCQNEGWFLSNFLTIFFQLEMKINLLFPPEQIQQYKITYLYFMDDSC